MKSRQQQQMINSDEQINQYQEKSIEDKQQMKKQLEKCKQHLITFTQKLEKKYNTKLIEDRKNYDKKIDKLEKSYKKNIEEFKDQLQQKNNTIRVLSDTIKKLEFQKKGIIEMNTKMLQDMAKDYQQSESIKPTHSYKQLLQMYQYLIQENNLLKKQIYLENAQNKRQQQNIFKIQPKISQQSPKKQKNKKVVKTGKKK